MRHTDTQDVFWAAVFVGIIGLVVYCLYDIRKMNNTIKVIDGCEYIRHYNGHGFDLIHKGNCSNVVHYKK